MIDDIFSVCLLTSNPSKFQKDIIGRSEKNHCVISLEGRSQGCLVLSCYRHDSCHTRSDEQLANVCIYPFGVLGSYGRFVRLDDVAKRTYLSEIDACGVVEEGSPMSLERCWLLLFFFFFILCN